MRARTAVGDRRRTRQGSVCPAKGHTGALECPLAPHRPRRLPILVPTAQPAGDLRLAMERYKVGLAIQAP
jgi:hypothetical protein